MSILRLESLYRRRVGFSNLILQLVLGFEVDSVGLTQPLERAPRKQRSCLTGLRIPRALSV